MRGGDINHVTPAERAITKMKVLMMRCLFRVIKNSVEIIEIIVSDYTIKVDKEEFL
jgi:hypothetical protein